MRLTDGGTEFGTTQILCGGTPSRSTRRRRIAFETAITRATPRYIHKLKSRPPLPCQSASVCSVTTRGTAVPAVASAEAAALE
nr:hypothetical protein [Rubrobacter marinus]